MKKGLFDINPFDILWPISLSHIQFGPVGLLANILTILTFPFYQRSGYSKESLNLYTPMFPHVSFL